MNRGVTVQIETTGRPAVARTIVSLKQFGLTLPNRVVFTGQVPAFVRELAAQVNLPVHDVPAGPVIRVREGDVLTAGDFERARATAQTAPFRYAQKGGAINRFHLAYHLLPVRGRWAWHAERLRSAWHIFTGRKVISVAVGGAVREQETGHRLELDSAAAVRAALPADAELIVVPNQPDRWELPSWGELWDRVLPAADPLDAVFYGHAKGVSRPAGSTAERWTRILYDLCLRGNKPVDEQMRTFPIVGPLRKVGHFWAAGAKAGQHPPEMARSAWHYAGNFWWVRAGAAADRLAAVPVPEDRWGPEAWPGMAFRLEESGNLWSPPGEFHLYDPAWMARVETEFNQRPGRTLPGFPRLSVVIATKGRDTLPRTIASLVPQLRDGDQVLIERDESDDWGRTPRTNGMRSAHGDYLMFMDDDDVYKDDALAKVRAAIAANPGRLLVFQMERKAPYNDVLPTERTLRIGQLSTQMIVVPNDPDRLGEWGTRSGGDCDFAITTAAKHAEPPVWVDEVLSVWRPGGG